MTEPQKERLNEQEKRVRGAIIWIGMFTVGLGAGLQWGLGVGVIVMGLLLLWAMVHAK